MRKIWDINMAAGLARQQHQINNIEWMLRVLFKNDNQEKYIADNGIKNPFSTLKNITNVFDIELFLSGYEKDLASMKYITEPFVLEEKKTNKREPFKRRRDKMYRLAELSQRRENMCRDVIASLRKGNPLTLENDRNTFLSA